MKCPVCKEKDLPNSRAKYCSGACKMRARRGTIVVDHLPKAVTALPRKNSLNIPWQELYEKCDGCDGENCPSGFVPNWKRLGVDKNALKKLIK